MSLSTDTTMTMPVMPAYNGMGYNNGGMFGGDWFAWIIILLLFGGRWGNGFGGDSSCCAPATCADLQRGFDNQGVTNKLNGLESGLCSLGYDQLREMNGINTNVLQTGFGIQNAIQQGTVGAMQNTNAIQAQLASCCCDIEKGQLQLGNAMERGFCNLGNTVQNSARDIIDNQTSGINAIMSKLSQMEYNGLNDKYQAALAENQALKFQASQTAQNAFITANQEAQTAELLRRLGRDCPVPAYWVNPPTPVPVPCGTCNTCGC